MTSKVSRHPCFGASDRTPGARRSRQVESAGVRLFHVPGRGSAPGNPPAAPHPPRHAARTPDCSKPPYPGGKTPKSLRESDNSSDLAAPAQPESCLVRRPSEHRVGRQHWRRGGYSASKTPGRAKRSIPHQSATSPNSRAEPNIQRLSLVDILLIARHSASPFEWA